MSMFDQLVARLRDEQALTKSLNPGDALAAVGNGDANAPVLDQRALTKAGAFGVVQVGQTVQVVVGPIADNLADEIAELDI